MRKLALVCAAVLVMGTCFPAYSELMDLPEIMAGNDAQTSPPSGLLSRLSLRFYGAYADLGWGDLTQDLGSHDQIYRDLAAAYEKGSVTGEHRLSRSGLGGGAGLLVSVSKRLSLGLCFECLKKDGTSSQSLSLGWMEKSFQNAERTIRQRLDLVGILLQANVSFPLSGILDLYVGAGAGVYSAGIRYAVEWAGNSEYWGYGRHIDQNGLWKTDWFKYGYGDWSQEDSIEASGIRLGGSGWLGIRFLLSPRVSLFLEGKASLLKLGGPQAEEAFSFRESRAETAVLADLRTWTHVDDLESWETEGKLELYDFFSGDLNKTYTFVTANRPYREDEGASSNFRPAAINLNHVQIILGIELRLF